MEIGKTFQNGQSQAVRLPKSCRISGDEVYVQKIGDAVLLVPKDKVWKTFMEGLNGFSNDFMQDGRADPSQSPREAL